MNRIKFQRPDYPTFKEKQFIERLEHTHDRYGLSESTLCIMLSVKNARTLRTFKERYNNRKYIGVTLQGKIVCYKGLYRLIRPNSKYAMYYKMKAKFDKSCALINEMNTRLALGETLNKGQLQMDIDKLIQEAEAQELELKQYEKLFEQES